MRRCATLLPRFFAILHSPTSSINTTSTTWKPDCKASWWHKSRYLHRRRIDGTCQELGRGHFRAQSPKKTTLRRSLFLQTSHSSWGRKAQVTQLCEIPFVVVMNNAGLLLIDVLIARVEGIFNVWKTRYAEQWCITCHCTVALTRTNRLGHHSHRPSTR